MRHRIKDFCAQTGVAGQELAPQGEFLLKKAKKFYLLGLDNPQKRAQRIPTSLICQKHIHV